ncbi:DUF397 domain-containing protein [Patescibacteria group bacterium]
MINTVNFRDKDFKKSSFTFTDAHKACAEVAIKDNTVAVRNSRDLEKNTIYFNFREWDAFIKGVKAGEFNL